MGRLGPALVAALALAVGGCGGSSGAAATTGAAASVTASTSSSSTAPSGSTSTAASTTVTTTVTATATGSVPGPARCVAADLSLSFLGQQGATGHGLLGFALKNTSAHSCHTFGYPGVLFLGKSGQPLPTNAARTTSDFFGSAPEVSLVLSPGQHASFRIGVTHGMASPAGCTTAYGLQAIAPDDTATLRTEIPGGSYECRAATVSPLRPGTSAYP